MIYRIYQSEYYWSMLQVSYFWQVSRAMLGFSTNIFSVSKECLKVMSKRDLLLVNRHKRVGRRMSFRVSVQHARNKKTARKIICVTNRNTSNHKMGLIKSIQQNLLLIIHITKLDSVAKLGEFVRVLGKMQIGTNANVQGAQTKKALNLVCCILYVVSYRLLSTST